MLEAAVIGGWQGPQLYLAPVGDSVQASGVPVLRMLHRHGPVSQRMQDAQGSHCFAPLVFIGTLIVTFDTGTGDEQ